MIFAKIAREASSKATASTVAFGIKGDANNRQPLRTIAKLDDCKPMRSIAGYFSLMRAVGGKGK